MVDRKVLTHRHRRRRRTVPCLTTPTAGNLSKYYRVIIIKMFLSLSLLTPSTDDVWIIHAQHFGYREQSIHSAFVHVPLNRRTDGRRWGWRRLRRRCGVKIDLDYSECVKNIDIFFTDAVYHRLKWVVNQTSRRRRAGGIDTWVRSLAVSMKIGQWL